MRITVFSYTFAISHIISKNTFLMSLLFRAAAATLIASPTSTSAVAPYPLPVNYTAPDGTVTQVLIKGNENSHYYLDATTLQGLKTDDFGKLVPMTPAELSTLSAASEAVHTKALGQHESFVPASGSPRICVILVEFSDVKFAMSDPASYYTRALNTQGFSDNGNTGSVRDYFSAQSSGSFTPQFDVYGPVTLSSPRSSYSSTQNNAYKMVHEGAAALDSQVDFSVYDLNNNGDINHVCIIFAGQGANFGAAGAPWPHNSDCPTGILSRKKVDGKILHHYMCTSEIGYTSTDGIGTFVHEFGHALGLPDLYNTISIGSDTPNWWSVMDVGSYLDKCTAPCNYSAFERTALGWHTYTPLTAAADVRLRPLADHNFSCVIETGRDRDFYVLENRPATGWDRALPGSGMLIWHIDGNDQSAISSQPNNNPSHLLIDLVRADNSWETALDGDPWPGSTGNSAFTATSVPAMTRWESNATNASRIPVTGKDVTDITRNATNGLISFKFMGGNSSNVIDPAPPSEQVTISVVASPSEGGTVNIGRKSATTVNAKINESVSLHATAADGYNFIRWDLNGVPVSAESSYTFTVTADNGGTYTAVFEADANTLLIKTVAEPAEGGIAFIGDDASRTVYRAKIKEFVKIHAKPAEGYKFDYWMFNGNPRPYLADYIIDTYDKSDEGTYTAVFIPDPASIDRTADDAAEWTLSGLTLSISAPYSINSAVYTTSGSVVAPLRSAAQRTIPLPATGIYILMVDGQAIRILAM